jgi:di/tricarboxylate transporter
MHVFATPILLRVLCWFMGIKQICSAAAADGIITLIGTSTNLVRNGLMIENGIEGFNFWDFLISQ